MPLTKNRPFDEVALAEGTTSIATTPVVAVMVAPVAGFIERVAVAAGGTTTGTITVAVSVNGGADIFGGALTLPAQTGAVAGVVNELPLVGVSAVHVNEGDIITLTPSGGTGASIPGAFTTVIRKDA